MASSITTVQDFMTNQPISIGRKDSILEAQRVMADHRIRHLPVISGQRIFGIVSDRDIKMALGFIDSRPDKMAVSQICQQKPYMIEAATPLAEVAEVMARRHIGCALIHRNKKLVGIFTTVDACKALSKLLKGSERKRPVRPAKKARRKG